MYLPLTVVLTTISIIRHMIFDDEPHPPTYDFDSKEYNNVRYATTTLQHHEEHVALHIDDTLEDQQHSHDMIIINIFMCGPLCTYSAYCDHTIVVQTSLGY